MQKCRYKCVWLQQVKWVHLLIENYHLEHIVNNRINTAIFTILKPIMGNYCSSTKKDKDNISDKSEEWVFFIILMVQYFSLP